ncbi:MAG TPA: MFS transporter [Amycolatopsis sp.]|nr:MFS transporter [Amycolatopsis sp.]
MTTVADAPGRITPGWRYLTPLVLGSALNPVNSSVLATALVAIGQAFRVSAASAAGLVAALYLASAIGQPAMGKLAERFGARTTFLCGLVLVALGGLLGALAEDFTVLLVARAVLGIGTAAGYPTAMMLVRRWAAENPGARAEGAIGALAIAGQTSATIGLPLGGLLVALGGWRVTFLINVPLALLTLAAALRWLPRRSRVRESSVPLANALDVPGMALFAAATASLIVFFQDLHQPRWVVAGVGVVLTGTLLWWETRAKHPFVDVRMLVRNRALSATYVRVAIMFLLSYCVLYGFTQWLEQGRHLTASAAGYVMVPMSVAAALLAIPFSRGNRIRTCLLATGIAAVVGPACLLTFHGSTPIWLLITVTMTFAVISGLGVLGNQAALYHQAPAETIGVAAGLLRTFTYIGAILSSSLIGVAYGDRASDAGLHTVAVVLTGLGMVLLLLTVFALRGLPRGENQAPIRPAAVTSTGQRPLFPLHRTSRRRQG